MTVMCSVCGTENPADGSVCLRCGVALVMSTISLVGDIEIRLGGEERAVFQLAAPEVEGYVLGRTDEASDYIPDVDLAHYGGREQGVSRRHAALIRYHGTIHVLDLFSVNGTYLNGKRLSPDTPYPLNAGDDLKLGNLSLALRVPKR